MASRWQSLSRNSRALIVTLPLALVLLVAAAVGGANGSANSPGSPGTPTPAAAFTTAPATSHTSAPAPRHTRAHHPHARRHHQQHPRQHHRRQHHPRKRHPRKRHHRAIVAPVPSPTPTGCYPLSDSGSCYEPGEYCRDSDAGVTGLAGDGEQIICRDNDGLRWEPV
jgi:hypothetical protein